MARGEPSGHYNRVDRRPEGNPAGIMQIARGEQRGHYAILNRQIARVRIRRALRKNRQTAWGEPGGHYGRLDSQPGVNLAGFYGIQQIIARGVPSGLYGKNLEIGQLLLNETDELREPSRLSGNMKSN